MSKLLVFAVRDNRAELFLKPAFQKNTVEAIRNWEIMVNEGDSMVSRFPNEYSLLELGSFDESTGVFTNGPVVDHGVAAQVLKAPSQPMPLFSGGQPVATAAAAAVPSR